MVLRTLSSGEVTMCATNDLRGSFSDTAPQSNSLDLVDSEAVFTGFANSCAKAGGNRCLLAGMIKGIAVGSDVSTLVTSTIDVSLSAYAPNLARILTSISLP